MKRRSQLLALPIPWARLESLNAFNDLCLNTHSSERSAHLSPVSAGQSILSFGIQADPKAFRLTQASRTGDENTPAGPQSLNAFNSPSGISLVPMLLKSKEHRELSVSWTFSKSLNAFNDSYSSAKTLEWSARCWQGYIDQSKLFLSLQTERSVLGLSHTRLITDKGARIGSQSLNAFNDLYPRVETRDGLIHFSSTSVDPPARSPRAHVVSLGLEPCLTGVLRLADRQGIDGTGQKHRYGLAPALNAFNARTAAIAGESIPGLRVSFSPAMDFRLGDFARVQNRKSGHGRSSSRSGLPCVECIQRLEVFCCSVLFFAKALCLNRGGLRMPDPPQ